MKLTDLAKEQARTNPNYADKTLEDVMSDLYQKQSSRAANLQRENNVLKKQIQKDPISVEVSTDGSFAVSKVLRDAGFASKATVNQITGSRTLKDLSSLLRPILIATKALYKGDGIINHNPLHVRDADGKDTKQPLINSAGQQLYGVDPISKLKAILFILDNNKQAQEAVETIGNVLNEYRDVLDRLEVTKSIFESTMPNMNEKKDLGSEMDEFLQTPGE